MNATPPIPTVRQNVLANFAGKAWIVLASLLFVPVYLKQLGIEAYGLIGLYLSLLGLLSVLDMGLSTTLSRELARLSSIQGAGQEARNMVRTLEAVYWGVGLLIGALILLAAPFLAGHWVKVKALPAGTVYKAFLLMGFLVAFEWPSALYTGGLIGLQHQVRLNGIRAVGATFQSAGAAIIVTWVSPSILAYFAWQAFVALGQATFLGYTLWSALPPAERGASFQKGLLAKNWKFTAGMTGITILVTVITQSDKIILSKLLSLESFGYYVLAFNVASALNHLASPLFTALFPKFSQLVAARKESDLTALYHAGSQLLALVVMPAAVTLGFFAREILSLWIRDPATAGNTHLLLRLLLAGTMFNALMVTPYAAQLAHGWTRLSFYANAAAASIGIPAFFWAATRHGASGVAVVWIALNLGYVLLEVPFMHRKILRNEMAKWYREDVGMPLVLAIGTGLLSRALFSGSLSPWETLAWIFLSAVATVIAASLPMSRIRFMARRILEGDRG